VVSHISKNCSGPGDDSITFLQNAGPYLPDECDISEDSNLQQHNHEYLKTASSSLSKISTGC